MNRPTIEDIVAVAHEHYELRNVVIDTTEGEALGQVCVNVPKLDGIQKQWFDCVIYGDEGEGMYIGVDEAEDYVEIGEEIVVR